MDLPAEFSNPNFDPKAWINSTLRPTESDKTCSAQINQLITRLQLQSQETATAVEEIISQSIVRLPRASLEVQRMATDTRTLGEALKTIVHATEKSSVSADEQSRVAELCSTRDKLLECQSILREARTLNQRVLAVEQQIDALMKGDCSMVNHDGLAAELAELQKSLRRLQQFDPNYGTATQNKVSEFESKLQQTLEKGCLEAIRNRDPAAAPKLFSTLRKIGRHEPAILAYIDNILQTIRTFFANDVMNRGATTLHHALLDFNRKLLKTIANEKPFIGLLFEGDSGAVRLFHEQLLNTFFGAVQRQLSDTLKGLEDNDELVRCFTAAHVVELEAFGEKVVAASLKAFEPTVDSFCTREAQRLLGVELASAPPQDSFKLLAEAIEQSARRTLAFYPEKTVSACVGTWNDAVVRLSSVARPPRDSVSDSSASLGDTEFKEVLQAAVAVHGRASSLPPLILAFEGHLTCVVGAAWQASPSTPTLLAKARTAIVTAAAEADANVRAALLSRTKRTLQSYVSLPVWREGAPKTSALASYGAGHLAPTETIRSIGESLMELPMLLESLGTDSASSQRWMSSTTSEVLGNLISSIRSLALHSRYAVEQLFADIDYIQNVWSAITEEPSVELQQIVQLLANCNPSPAAPQSVAALQ